MCAALFAASLALTVNAHLFISSPEPIEGTAIKSPLDASGSNFPCHGVALPSSGGQSMAAGSSQLLAFDTGNGANTAVHGGGSCQLSLTYETDADKVKDPKNWLVIYSIEGGCPSNTHQNLDSSYTGPSGTYTGAFDCTDPKTNGVDCINQFNFTIPKGVKSGHAIMAWTWFNSVGNREMYMNCMNTELSGGDGSEMSDFPNMFVANLASVNTCASVQSVDLSFPNPGKYVLTKKPEGAAAATAVTFPLAKPTGAGCADDGGSGSGSGSGSSPASSAVAYSTSAPAPISSAYSAASAVAQASSTGSASAPIVITTMATMTSSQGVASTARPSSYGGPPSHAVPSPMASAPAYSSNQGSSSNASTDGCATSSIACASDGAVVCIGSSQFGICDHGCAVPQPLAAGTSCSAGVIAKRSSGRHMRHHVRHAS